MWRSESFLRFAPSPSSVAELQGREESLPHAPLPRPASVMAAHFGPPSALPGEQLRASQGLPQWIVNQGTVGQ